MFLIAIAREGGRSRVGGGRSLKQQVAAGELSRTARMTRVKSQRTFWSLARLSRPRSVMELGAGRESRELPRAIKYNVPDG